MNRYRAAGGGLLLTILIAACSSPSGSGAEPTEVATPTPVVTPTPPAESDGGGASFVPGAGELADIVPEEVGGLTIDYSYASGNAIMGSDGMTPELQDFLDAVGADVQDIQTAFGFAFDVEGGSSISVFAFRIIGADESRLRDEFRTVMEAENAGSNVVTETNVGGKDVLAFTTEGETEPSGYMYVKSDLVFIVAGSPLTLVEDALSQLP